MAELKMVIEIPELEALMADVQQIKANFEQFQVDLSSKLDSIDNVIDQLRSQVQAGQVDQAVVDQLAGEVSSARDSLAAVNVEDPSSDDPATPADTPPTT
jgi:predicted  nucleic acid-binding Zn-ribbon protein